MMVIDRIQGVISIILSVIITVGVPLFITVRNFYNLFSSTPKKEKLFSWLTIIIGGIFYISLYQVLFEPYGDWNESIYAFQTHYSLSSRYKLCILLILLVGMTGLIVLCNFDENKLSPIVSAFSTSAVIILNIFMTAYAAQLIINIVDIGLFLYVYHLNIFIISVTAVRRHLRQQLENFNDAEKTAETHWLYRKMKKFSNYKTFIFICFFFIIAVLEIIFIITGQGWDAPIKAFTDTADWTFSMQTPPPPKEYSGHYLCTVAAGGHKNVVKPLRYGTRHGTTIIVNRQLCIANAFEDFIHEKMPVSHKHIRNFYDKYGFPLSKLITTPLKADIVYIIMKPLEWLFLLFLYTFDAKPEKRINRQYLYKNH